MIRAHLTQKPQGSRTGIARRATEGKEQARGFGDSEMFCSKVQGHGVKHDTGTMEQHQNATRAVRADGGVRRLWRHQYIYAVSFFGSQYGGTTPWASAGDRYPRFRGTCCFPDLLPLQLANLPEGMDRCPDAADQGYGKFYVALFAHPEQYKGIYVDYVRTPEVSHSFIGRVGREKFTFKPVPKPFDWMIRVKLSRSPGLLRCGRPGAVSCCISAASCRTPAGGSGR